MSKKAAAPRTRDELLAALLTDLQSLWLGIECRPPCTRVVFLPFRLLAARHPGLRLHELLARLKCSSCGHGPGRAFVTDDPNAGGVSAHPNAGHATVGGAKWFVDVTPVA